MWFTSAFNKIKTSGIGGGILPPLPRTNNQIATDPEAQKMKQQAVEQSMVPPPPEKQPLQKRLEGLHTNGRFPVPMSAYLGQQNLPAAIEDQHQGDYQEYVPQSSV